MSIIKLSDGRYALRWRDAQGKRHYETLDPMPFAKVKQEHAKRIVGRDKAASSRATIAHLCSEYLKLHDVVAKRPFTVEGRIRAEGIVRQITGDPERGVEADPLAGVVASEAKPKDFLQWRLRRKAAGVSDATLDREANLIRAVCNLAVEIGELDASPIKRGAIKRLVSSTDGRIIYFEPQEWRAFISALDDEARWKKHVEGKRRFGPKKIGASIDTPRVYGAGRRGDSEATREYRERLLQYRGIFSALLWTGSRVSEVRLLRWEGIDFRGGYVHVPMGKPGKSKVVPLHDELRAELESRPRGIGKAYVYPHPDGRPYKLQEVQRAFNVYRDVAALRKELTPHAIRHTVASWMVIAGRPIKEVQEFLGHASLAMTLRYVHLAPVHLRGALGAITQMRDSERGVVEADASALNTVK